MGAAALLGRTRGKVEDLGRRRGRMFDQPDVTLARGAEPVERGLRQVRDLARVLEERAHEPVDGRQPRLVAEAHRTRDRGLHARTRAGRCACRSPGASALRTRVRNS